MLILLINFPCLRNAFTRVALMALALLASNPLVAQERKAYKVVDANGNVTYSQTPPVDGQDAQKLSTKPAIVGRGGYVGGSAGSYSPYDDPRLYSNQYAGRQGYNPNYNAAGQRQPTAQEQRYTALKAECERQRGTDCNNPSTLQYMDSTSVPGGRGRPPAINPRPGT